MATWVNILDVLYPVGAVYFSTASTSPASTIGGSWTQIKGAVIAAYGSNGYTLKNYGGSLAISESQMPSHTHRAGSSSLSTFCTILSRTGISGKLMCSSSSSDLYVFGSKVDKGGDWSDLSNPFTTVATGGGRTSYLDTLEFISGIERPDDRSHQGGTELRKLFTSKGGE